MCHAGGQMVLVVAQRHVDHLKARTLPDHHARVVVRHHVVQQISAGGAGPENPDRLIAVGRVITGVLQGMPGRL